MTALKVFLKKISFSQRRKFAYNLLILGAGEIFNRVVVAIAFIHLARVLQPEAYGMLEFALAILMILTVIVDQGLGPIGTREIAKDPAKTELLAKQIISMQLIAGLLLSILITIVITVLPIGNVLSFLIIGYAITLLGYPFLLNWLFQGQNKMEWVTFPQVVRQTIFAIIVLGYIQKPEQVIFLPLIELVTVCIAGVINIIVYLRQKARLTIDLISGFDLNLFLESIPVGGSQVIWALRMYLPTVILGSVAGKMAVGYFSPSQRIIMVFQAVLLVYFINVFPNMSRAYHISGQQLIKLIHSSLRLLLWPTIFGALIVTSIASKLIGLIYGKAYLTPETILVFVILIWSIPVINMRSHGRNALIVLGHQRDELLCSLSAMGLLIILLLPLISLYGSGGAAWAMLISEIIGAGLVWWRLRIYLPDVKLAAQFIQLPSFELLVEESGDLE